MIHDTMMASQTQQNMHAEGVRALMLQYQDMTWQAWCHENHKRLMLKAYMGDASVVMGAQSLKTKHVRSER